MSEPGSRATIRVRTFKAEGKLLSRLAHDLELRLDDFELSFEDGKVTLGFVPASLVVEGAVVDGMLVPEALSKRDKAEIATNIREKVLHTGRHSRGRFEGTYVTRADRVRVEGMLTLLSETRSVGFDLLPASGGFRGDVELVPSRWGIEPFTAMLGALKLKDRVRVIVSVARPTPPALGGVLPDEAG